MNNQHHFNAFFSGCLAFVVLYIVFHFILKVF